MTSNCRVWVGRFQPFHSGHLETLIRLLNLPDTSSLVVAVISFAPVTHQASGPGDATGGTEQNPLSAFHRRQMIERLILARHLESRVSVVCLPRTDLFWPIASDMLPPDRQICVTTGRSGDNEFELQKAKDFQARGEEICTVDISDQPYTSGTRIRRLVRRGGDIRALVPTEVLEYLEENDLMAQLLGPRNPAVSVHLLGTISRPSRFALGPGSRGDAE